VYQALLVWPCRLHAEVGGDSAALNTALSQMTQSACNGTIVFTTDGATLRYDKKDSMPERCCVIRISFTGMAQGTCAVVSCDRTSSEELYIYIYIYIYIIYIYSLERYADH
jgi:hypothetical protein